MRLYAPCVVLAVWALFAIFFDDSNVLRVTGLCALSIAIGLHISDELKQRR